MASRVGADCEYVTRIHSDLKKKDIVQRSSEGIKILDLAKLELLLDDCQCS